MPKYLPKLESHLRRLASALVDMDGVRGTSMWPSVLDVRTGRYPEGDHVPRRVYRLVGAPRGSTTYWDQPLLVAAYGLTDWTGSPWYAQAADRYIEEFLAHCVAEDGMFLWGNHRYYDVFDNRVVGFLGGHHELRPITPAWDVFWQHDPERTAKYIRAMGRRHVYDRHSGGFNRHDDGKKGHAFLEAGGILAESLAWLYGKTGDEELRDLALRIARYSYRHRGTATGLLVNEPDMGRWDSKVSTTEVGVWAQSLLRAGVYTSSEEFVEMARHATRAYLDHGYEDASRRYFGQVTVDSAAPVIPSEAGYWPSVYADVWNTNQWPTHDYPMAVAEACVTLYAMTHEQVFLDAIQRWSRIAADTRPVRTGNWAYAENYGRCIHFMVRAGRQIGDERLLHDASVIADEAVDCLCECGMFQGYPGAHVYESVDGVGYLFLALILLGTGREANLQGFGF